MPIDEKYPLALPAGTILAGQYTIDKVLGQGGFGITYKATDYKTGGKVAVKEFFPDTLAYREKTTVISYPGERSENYTYGKEGFLQEAKTLAEFIGCESIVRIHSYFEENGTAYFVMDYIEGISFDEYLRQHGGRITVEEAKKILVPVMDALAVVHSKGIVHRDVTPDNIYITNDGTVKLLDFGAARYSLGDKSRSLDVILKHGFAPKEQYTRRGKQGPFTDVYCLGATFYFAITGRRPPDSVERLDEDDLIPPSNLGVQITDYQEKAILHALNVQPAERFQTMGEFKNVLLNENSVPQQYFNTPVQPMERTVQMIQPSSQPVQQTSQPVQQQYYNAPPQAMERTQMMMQPKPAKPEKKAKSGKGFKKVFIVLAAAAALMIGVTAVPKLLGSSDDESSIASNDTNSSGTTTAAEKVIGPQHVLGNTPGNIQNDGLLCQTDSYAFWVDENYHIVKGTLDGSTKTMLEGKSSCFSNLCYVDGLLYYIYNKRIAYYDPKTDEFFYNPYLENYTGDELRLYITEDYFFVFSKNENDAYGTLYRISRNTGVEEQSATMDYSTNFTIHNDKLYYTSLLDNGLVCIRSASARDFSKVDSGYYYFYEATQNLTNLVAFDDYIYCFSRTNTNETFINKIKDDFSEMVGQWNITSDAINIAGNKYYTSNLNVYNNQICYNVYDKNALIYAPALCHITCTSNSEYKSRIITKLGSNVWGAAMSYIDNEIEVDYFDPDDGSMYYLRYDKDGNKIENDN